MNSYGQICDTKPAVLREIYRNLTGDHTALTTKQEKEIHQRIVECLEWEDSILIFDLRVNSGRVEDYLPFLEEVKKHIQSQVETGVSDRRHDAVDHGQVVTHMAIALNAVSLYKVVVKKITRPILASPCRSCVIEPLFGEDKDQVYDYGPAMSSNASRCPLCFGYLAICATIFCSMS